MSGAVPTQTAADVASDYATFEFIVTALLSRTATAQLVAVRACTNNGALSPWGTVDVVPLVNQVAGDGTNVPHGTLYRLPYFRNQSGGDAIIIDPKPGDIGLAVFAMRDISAVKSDPVSAAENANGTAGTPPGSTRQYDMADGLYFGGFLNAAPTQYVRFSSTGIELVSPTKIRLQAPTIELAGAVDQTTSDHSTFTGPLAVQGTDVHTHVHPGVTRGGASTDPPA